MPKSGIPLLLLALAGILAVPGEAAKGCPDHLREIKQLYAARNPDLLAVNILEPGCTPRELYQAAYYQGFGFYFVGRYKDALANFQLARSLTGPWDEQVLQYIFTIQGRLGQDEAQSRTLDEFREDFPKSRKLVEMETAERRTVKTSFDGLATGGLAWLAGERFYQGAKGQGLVGASFTQTRGTHSVSEYANVSGGSSLEGRSQYYYGLEGGALYRSRALSAQAELGRLRSAYPKADGDSASANPSVEPDTAIWEWVWTGSLAHSFRRPGGWTWTANLNHFRLGESFTSYGFTWEMDRRVGFKTSSMEATAELQDFKLEGGCVSTGQGTDRCGSSSTRFAAAEVVWEVGRTAGRHILGSEIQLRFEEGIFSSLWRGLATGGLSYGLRLSPGVKLSNVLDLGGEWRKDGSGPVVDLPVLAVRSSLAWFF